MKRFAELFETLDATTKTNTKVAALADYFRGAEPADVAWAVYFLVGERLKRLIPTRLLRQWAAEEAGIPDWLFDQSYEAVGDLAETISLVLPPTEQAQCPPLAVVIERHVLPLRGQDEAEQRAAVTRLWKQTPANQRLVLMKLMTGAFRVGVSRGLVTRALATATGIESDTIAHRLMGHWQPTADFHAALIDPDTSDSQHSQPYPFCLAHPVETVSPAEEDASSDGPREAPQSTADDQAPDDEVALAAQRLSGRLGDVDQFLVEWKWDGIRGQLIRRAQRTFVWSRGGELMEDRWPEIELAATHLPSGTVLDGEILAVAQDRVLPFTQLQRRINRRTVGKKLLSEVPVQFRAFDVLEHHGRDTRGLPLTERRGLLEEILGSVPNETITATELHQRASWHELAAIRETARQERAEGLMIKHAESRYEVGRVRGVWWKWKVEPYTIDAVMIYAQAGHGRRANLFTDYTFAVWNGDQLVPFAKAYSGLSDAEIRQVDRFVRRNTVERFGPVRSVRPELVMELAFEGLQPSTRHKSGVAVRFPRIVRWRHDKQPADANSLDDLLGLSEL